MDAVVVMGRLGTGRTHGRDFVPAETLADAFRQVAAQPGKILVERRRALPRLPAELSDAGPLKITAPDELGGLKGQSRQAVR